MRSVFGRAWKWPALAVLAGAGVLAATAATSSSASTAATTSTTQTQKPSVVAGPTISGTAQEGQTLDAHPGTWSGTQPITYSYEWERCDTHGDACILLSSGRDGSYGLDSDDVGHTLRVRVTATNSAGSSSARSDHSSVVSAKPAPPPTTTTKPAPPKPPATGCPNVKKGTVVGVNSVGSPARLQIADFTPSQSKLTADTHDFSLQVIVNDSCGQRVAGALVYATAVPYNQFSIPPEQATNSAGIATLQFQRLTGYPASSKQELLAMFIRARKPDDPILGGISTRRLISVPVSLRG